MDTLGLRFSTHQLIACARDVAFSMQHSYVNVDHVLIALPRIGDCLALIHIMNELGAPVDRVAETVSAKMSHGIPNSIPNSSVIKESPHFHKVLDIAYREADSVGALSVAPEHVMIGILTADAGIARRVLNQDFGITLTDFIKRCDSPVTIS